MREKPVETFLFFFKIAQYRWQKNENDEYWEEKTQVNSLLALTTFSITLVITLHTSAALSEL